MKTASTDLFCTNVVILGKRRKEEGGFPGADIILKQIKDAPQRRRVGFTSTGAPARGMIKSQSYKSFLLSKNSDLINLIGQF